MSRFVVREQGGCFVCGVQATRERDFDADLICQIGKYVEDFWSRIVQERFA
jgi:hypothetical protein